MIDVGRLSFIDSTGLNLLVQTLQTVGNEGRMTLLAPTPFLRRLLRVAGLDRHPSVILMDGTANGNGHRSGAPASGQIP